MYSVLRREEYGGKQIFHFLADSENDLVQISQDFPLLTCSPRLLCNAALVVRGSLMVPGWTALIVGTGGVKQYLLSNNAVDWVRVK